MNKTTLHVVILRCGCIPTIFVSCKVMAQSRLPLDGIAVAHRMNGHNCLHLEPFEALSHLSFIQTPSKGSKTAASSLRSTNDTDSQASRCVSSLLLSQLSRCFLQCQSRPSSLPTRPRDRRSRTSSTLTSRWVLRHVCGCQCMLCPDAVMVRCVFRIFRACFSASTRIRCIAHAAWR